MEETILHRCKLSECNVGTTGKCVEGLDIGVCPNYIHLEQENAESPTNLDSEIASTIEGTAPTDEMIELASGSDFDLITGARITRARLTRVVVIAGAKDSGKTTIISSLYDRFQEGQFAGYLFAGSDTLPGLERRCFPSRLSSERTMPDTVRTTRGDGQKLLHLKVRQEDLKLPAQDLLLADISGEFFKDACDSDEGCRKLQILKRADHVALALDGEKLSNAALRHEVVQTAILLLQSALSAEMIGRNTSVEILTTKRDRLDSNLPTHEYVHNTRSKMITQFSKELGTLRFFDVAARPQGSEFPFAYGLDELLKLWAEHTMLLDDSSAIDFRTVSSGLAKTEFDRFGLKQ